MFAVTYYWFRPNAVRRRGMRLSDSTAPSRPFAAQTISPHVNIIRTRCRGRLLVAEPSASSARPLHCLMLKQHEYLHASLCSRIPSCLLRSPSWGRICFTLVLIGLGLARPRVMPARGSRLIWTLLPTRMIHSCYSHSAVIQEGRLESRCLEE